jgi:micrococcal nuclease
MSKNRALSATLLLIAISLSNIYSANAVTTITKVYDGDTVTLATGERVRLLQIDTPELSPAECYGKEARMALISLLSSPGQISLKTDPSLDTEDSYGRLLRYIFIGKTNINLKLVEIGAAVPYFYKGDRGQYSAQFLRAAQIAKSKSIGIWSKCPGTRLMPTRSVRTTRAISSTTPPVNTSGTQCDSNYAGCIPVFASDINCKDIKQLGLAPVRVIGQDIHKLDGDGDGMGCDK